MISERAKPEQSGDAKPRILIFRIAGLPKRWDRHLGIRLILKSTRSTHLRQKMGALFISGAAAGARSGWNLTTDFGKISERAKPEQSGDAKPRVLTFRMAGLPKRWGRHLGTRLLPVNQERSSSAEDERSFFRGNDMKIQCRGLLETNTGPSAAENW